MSSSPQSRLANRIYLAASALGAEERQQYLDDHCPDPDVRQLVEDLLAGDQIEALETGSRLGHYLIQGRLGAGGMGCVYEAQDPRLNRTVAIKVLPLDRQYDGPNPLAREAQAASSLNHPNIVTVYEIGRSGATDFIVMERIAGQTLAHIIGSHGIELRQALRLAIQVADAVAAAHEAGIVHRDLKPGNVMATERGLVKVLDFGLAKRVAVEPDGDQKPTATMTKPGKVYGTVAYMSPEQAQGVQVDSRSDVFSFGCLLYEMVTGQRAFHEEGELLTLAAVVGKDPRPANQWKPGLSPAVGRIIETCLRKKRIDRWQSMADVKLLLESALEELTSPALANGGRRRSAFAIPMAVLAGAAIAAGAFWLNARRAPETPAAPLLRRVTMDSGLSAFPALSRAGNLLAFASDRGNRGNLDIWIQQIGGRDPIQLTRDDSDDSDPNISPDGTRVAFRSERSGGGIYTVPALGGEEVLIAPGGRNPQFSPDGRWIAYWEGRELGGYLPGSARVFVVETGGGQPRQVGPDMVAALYPVWSPKGDSLLVLGRRDAEGNLEDAMDWWLLPLENGPASRTGAYAQFRKQGLVRPAWEIRIRPLLWHNEPRNRVLFAAGPADAAGSSDVGNLWEIELPPGGSVHGPAVSLTSGPGYHLQASVSPVNGRDRMAFTNFDWKVGVWETALDAERGQLRGDFHALTPQESYAVTPSLSRDGKILAFVSRRLGSWGLHSRDIATAKEITLVTSGPEISLVSGDGRTVVYGDRAGNIFALPRAGGKVDKLCDRCGSPMGMSFDGTRITYEPLQSEDLTLYDSTRKTDRRPRRSSVQHRPLRRELFAR